jgi:hypothetical protein
LFLTDGCSKQFLSDTGGSVKWQYKFKSVFSVDLK